MYLNIKFRLDAFFYKVEEETYVSTGHLKKKYELA